MDITEALKTDIAHVGDLTKTAGGDLGTISGLANLKRALFHRLMTVPGTLVHRPTYGVGLPMYQNSPSSFGLQQKLASLIQEQFKQDPRIQAVKGVIIETADDAPQITHLKVFITPVGYTEQVMTFTPFSKGNS